MRKKNGGLIVITRGCYILAVATDEEAAGRIIDRLDRLRVRHDVQRLPSDRVNVLLAERLPDSEVLQNARAALEVIYSALPNLPLSVDASELIRSGADLEEAIRIGGDTEVRNALDYYRSIALTLGLQEA